MKIFHTADWHLGKVVQGVSMIEDQAYILKQFIEEIKLEQPDVIVIAGDLYDRAIPPPEAVTLLNDVLEEIVIELNIPVIAIAGNHDSPSRLQFGSQMMRERGFYLFGEWVKDQAPVIFSDDHGIVHFHPVPYCDPSIVRNEFADESIKTHQDAMKAIVHNLKDKMKDDQRHVFIGHAFVTPYGEAAENTSDSERRLSIGGAEHVNAELFSAFDYVALGHLHRAHYVKEETIRYAGSILKYSASEANHQKGFYIIDLNEKRNIHIEKRVLIPRHDLRIVEDTIEQILSKPRSDDYIFVKLLDKKPVLSPMEKIRSVFPNTLHIERHFDLIASSTSTMTQKEKATLSDIELFQAFYKEVRGFPSSADAEQVFIEVLEEMILADENIDN